MSMIKIKLFIVIMTCIFINWVVNLPRPHDLFDRWKKKKKISFGWYRKEQLEQF